MPVYAPYTRIYYAPYHNPTMHFSGVLYTRQLRIVQQSSSQLYIKAKPFVLCALKYLDLHHGAHILYNTLHTWIPYFHSINCIVLLPGTHLILLTAHLA